MNHHSAVLLHQASIWTPASDEELGFRLRAVVNFYLYILCEILLKMLGAYGNKHKLNKQNSMKPILRQLKILSGT